MALAQQPSVRRVILSLALCMLLATALADSASHGKSTYTTVSHSKRSSARQNTSRANSATKTASREKSVTDTHSLTTFKSAPTQAVGVLTKTTVTTETHTVLSISGKPVTLPVLPDHEHGCYFCPTGAGGFVLSGYTLPGVYPSHTVTGFPTPIPEITIGTQGDPSFKPQSTSQHQPHNTTTHVVGTPSTRHSTIKTTTKAKTSHSGKSSSHHPGSTHPTSKSSSSQQTTFTVFPKETVVTLSKTTVAAGTHTEVTHNGKPTPIPIIPGHDNGCWFCPPGPGGFQLPGFSVPGVYPPGGPPAGFPNPFPAITIAPNGDPSFDKNPPKSNPPKSNPTKSPTGKKTTTDKTTKASSTGKSTKTGSTEKTTKTSSCEKTTVTDCSSSLSFGVNSAGKTTTTKTVSSCSHVTGCSIKGHTTTTATTSTATGCWSYNYGLNGQLNSDDNGLDYRKRGIAGRRSQQAELQRRGDSEPIPVIGSKNKCTLSANGKAAPVTIPAYPGPTDLEAFPTPGATWWFVPTTSAQAGACPTLTMTSFANSAALVAHPIMKNVAGGAGVYHVGGSIEPFVNTDHAYELKLLVNFMNSLLDNNQISCDDFNEFFMAADSSANNQPRLQVIFNQLPGNEFPDFVGMDAGINRVKAQCFPGGGGFQNVGNDANGKLQQLNEIAVAAGFTNSDAVASRFQKANSRIYAAWLGIDALVAQQKDCNAPQPAHPPKRVQGWAGLYSSFMTQAVKDGNQKITRKINNLRQTKDSDPDSYKNGVKAFDGAFPQDKWGLNAAALLDWSAKALAINKRDGGTCSKKGSSTAKSTTAKATGTATKHTTQSASTAHKTTASQPKKTSKASETSVKTSAPAPTTTSSAAKTTSHATTASRKCTLQDIAGGRAGILTHICACNDGSSPQATISANEYHCPDQVAVE